ncbi:MAG: type II CAAX endopeptidase family protein [Bacteroidota bacterium]
MEESSGQKPPELTPEATAGLTSFWYYKGEFRAVWKVSVYGTIAFLGMIFLAVGVYSAFPEADWRMTTPIVTIVGAMAASFFCAMLIDRRPVIELIGLKPHRHALRQLLFGVGITFLLQLLLVGMELLFGEARMQSGHVTISHTLSLLLYGFISFILVGFAEEILVRGYAFRILQKQGSVAIALLLTSGLFSLMHAGNPGIGWIGFANIFLAGVWLGVARVVTGSLWLSVGMHIGWNFFLGPVFGFPVSGIIERSLFITTPGGAEWISGGAFGPEGGILVTLLLIAATAALYHPLLRRKIAPDQVEEIGIETNEVHE